MTNAQHTPGPLEVVGEFFDLYVKGTNQYVCQSSKSLGDKREGTARLLVAAYTTYDKHFGPNAIAAAEADLLGDALRAVENLIPFAEACKSISEGSSGLRAQNAMQAEIDAARALLTKAGKDGQ